MAGVIHKWSLGRVLKPTHGAHFVLYSSGLSGAANSHTNETRMAQHEVEVEVVGSDVPFQMVLVSHEFNHELSKETQVLLSGLPDWATEVSCTSHWRSYLF